VLAGLALGALPAPAPAQTVDATAASKEFEDARRMSISNPITMGIFDKDKKGGLQGQGQGGARQGDYSPARR
jgi:hypothetical protein